MSTNLAARKVLENHNAHDLLDMLGLVDERGDTTPDDTSDYSDVGFSFKGTSPGAKHAQADTPARSREGMTTPGGMLAEEPPKKRAYHKSGKPRKPPKDKAECGTYSGYQRHYRVEGQRPVTCEPCIEARKKERKRYMADYRARKAVRAPYPRRIDLPFMPLDVEWRKRATCRTMLADTGRPLWDDRLDDEPEKERRARHEEAKLVCRHRCPVRQDCSDAVDYKTDEGIRGGHKIPSRDHQRTHEEDETLRLLRLGWSLDEAAGRARMRTLRGGTG